MGLLDVLNATQNDPRGQRGPTTGRGGLSPISLAVLGLLAYKAWKSATSQPSTASAAPAGPGPVQGQSSAAPAGPSPDQGASPGGLGDVLTKALGGILGGGAAGSVLSGGLADLLKQFQQAGQGEVAKSWVGNGPKQPISSDDLANALGADQVTALMSQSGLSREDLLSGLSQHLPAAVDELTPDGRLPTEQELSRSF